MATQPDEGVQPPNEDEQRPEDGAPNPETNDELQDEGDPPPPPSVEDVAREIGWVPKEDYKGDTSQWKPAADFIKEGRNIQRSTSRELSQLRSTVDTIARTNAEIMADRLEQQKRELTEQYNQFVEDGDAQAAFRASQRLIEVEQRAKQPIQGGPSPEALEFQDRNSTWFGKDQAATVRAQQVCNDMAARGVTDHATQLKAAERVIRAEYPEYFQNQQNGQQRPTPPQVAAPGSRSTAPTTGRTKGFADMPLEARKVAERLVDAGAITDTKAYADKYWALQNQGSK